MSAGIGILPGLDAGIAQPIKRDGVHEDLSRHKIWTIYLGKLNFASSPHYHLEVPGRSFLMKYDQRRKAISYGNPLRRFGLTHLGPFNARTLLGSLIGVKLFPSTHVLLWAALIILACPVAIGAAVEDQLKKLGFMVQESFVQAPNFISEDVTGKHVDSASFAGKLVLLNFWATWCPPCRLEMPTMGRLHGEFHGRGLEVVAVNLMETRDQVRAFVEEQELTYPILLDRHGEIAERYGVMRLPETVLIGRNGEVIGKAIGFKDWDRDDARQLVASLLGGAAVESSATRGGGAVETVPWAFPDLDPIAFRVGPISVRWYGLMYMFGVIGGYFVVRWIARRRGPTLDNEQLIELITYVAVGVVLGGRLGYAVFYNLSYYFAYPLQLLAFWQGGMSFHGGLIGAVLAGWWYVRKRGLSFYPAADCIFAAAPLGLGFGRLGNFINGELYGRPTEVAWGIVFPDGGPLPRHPSQLYEAFLEGGVLLVLLLWLSSRVRTDGILTWAFIGGYGVTRFAVEFFREPDAHLGLIWGLSRGQFLSALMVAAAAGFFWRYSQGLAAPDRRTPMV